MVSNHPTGGNDDALGTRDVGKNSLAALHPHLVREWDATANAPLRPDRIKATYDKACAVLAAPAAVTAGTR